MAATFAKLGAMTVQISVLNVALQAVCAMFLALAISLMLGVVALCSDQFTRLLM